MASCSAARQARARTTMKDYYARLGVDEDANEEEIKRAYRALAFKYHPDRNQGSKKAEEIFKEITEAYAVLADSQQRRRYDAMRASMSAYDRQRPGAGFSQEELFRDIFSDPNIWRIFADLAGDFQRLGFRFDEEFIKKIFLARGPIFFGGVFFGTFAPWWKILHRGGTRGDFTMGAKTPSGLLGKAIYGAGRKIGGLFIDKLLGQSHGPGLPAWPQSEWLDLNYSLKVSKEEAAAGSEKTMTYWRDGLRERLAIKIPQGIKSGTKLRLRGKGCRGKGGQAPGDLYINIEIEH